MLVFRQVAACMAFRFALIQETVSLIHKQECRTSVKGEECFRQVVWAMQTGIVEYPGRYPALTNRSSFEDFQRHLHATGRLSGVCPEPCAERALDKADGVHVSDGFVSQRTMGVKVHVASIGGSGTTAFMAELADVEPPIITNDIDDNDHIKHAPYSLLIKSRFFMVENPDMIVYLYGSPVRAIMSLDRRGYLVTQAHKTRTDPFPQIAPENITALAFNEDNDFLQIEKHFDSYYNQCDYPVAFLNIAEKTDHVEQLAHFLRTNATELRRVFVPWHLRTPSARIAVSSQELLDDIYDPDEVLPSAHDYKSVPDDVKLALDRKLSRVIGKFDALNGFKLLTPAMKAHCHQVVEPGSQIQNH